MKVTSVLKVNVKTKRLMDWEENPVHPDTRWRYLSGKRFSWIHFVFGFFCRN